MSVLLNYFKYKITILNGKLIKLSIPDIPVITSPNCITLDNGVFENFILADAPFAKALQILETCVSVNNSLCGKLLSSFEFLIKVDERFKVTLVPFIIPDLNLLSCELDNFTFNVLY